MSRTLLLVWALAAGARAHAGEPIKVLVFHTNDIHGWIMARPDKRAPDRLVGGAPALAALIARETGPKLVLDAGDWWQGTPEGSLTKGEAVADVFNAIGYDAVVIGNHEYDAGGGALRALIAKIKAPALSANTYGTDGRPAPWVRPWIVKEVAGVKFGIFGLTTSNMPRLAFPANTAGLVFRREVDAARGAVAALKAAGATVIIAVTHVGCEREGGPKFEGDQTLAREVPGIDLIVGGHSHTFLDRPIRSGGTLIVQAGSYLVKAGLVALEIDPQTKAVVSSSGRLISLRPGRGEDPAVKAAVARRAAAVGRLFETVLATAPASLGRESDRENALGDWMTDCYRQRLGADVALQNGGGIRAELPAGPVTLRAIFNAMPFDNALVKLSLRGADLRAALDHGVGVERVVQVSGAVLEYRRGRPAGRRLAAASVGGAPLDDAKTYSVSVLDFMTSGGDGYSAFDRFVSSEATGVLARDALSECARRQKTVVPPAAGRLISREG